MSDEIHRMTNTNEPAPPAAPPPAPPDIAAVKLQARLIHAACIAVLGGAVALRYTVLKDVPDVGTVMIPVVTLIWGALGFTPPQPILSLAIAALDYKKLSQMLLLRPAKTGNALHQSSRPPAGEPAAVPSIPPLPLPQAVEPTAPDEPRLARMEIVPPPLGRDGKQ